MCGRYSTIRLEWQKVHALYNVIPTSPAPNSYEPNGDVRPTTSNPIFIDGKIEFGRWWMHMPWAKKFEPQKWPTFNARSETVAEKATFKDAWNKGRRCLIPMDGFYEWKDKVPHFIELEGFEGYSLAGIYNAHDGILDKEGMPVNYTYSILTTANTPTFAPYHNRMTKPIHPDQYDAWLNASPDEAMTMLEPFNEEWAKWKFTPVEEPGAQNTDDDQGSLF